MRQLAKYAFANAKVRALKSFLLKEEELSRLSDLKTLQQLLEALKDTPYEGIFGSMNIDSPDLARIEKELVKNDIDIYRKVRDSLPDERNRFFTELLMQRYEVEELKAVLRFWHNKSNVKIERYIIGERISFDIDFNAVLAAKSFEDIISLLNKTPYKAALLKARDKFKKTASLFYVEAALDIDYYERLVAASRRLSATDRKVSQKILAIEIDGENIEWLIKALKYYSLGKSDIMDWIIPGGEWIEKKRISAFHTLNGLSEIMNSMPLGPYMRIKDMAESNIHLIEGLLYEVLSREVRRALGSFPFTIGTIFGYLILKQRETKSIISLIYARYYNLKKEEMPVC